MSDPTIVSVSNIDVSVLSSSEASSLTTITAASRKTEDSTSGNKNTNTNNNKSELLPLSPTEVVVADISSILQLAGVGDGSGVNSPTAAANASSSSSRAGKRLVGTNDQASYMSQHSIVPLLNDLLGSVVEEKPDDVLTFLIQYLSQLQADVTKARQMLERRNKGGGGGNNNTNSNQNGSGASVAKSSSIIEGADDSAPALSSFAAPPAVAATITTKNDEGGAVAVIVDAAIASEDIGSKRSGVPPLPPSHPNANTSSPPRNHRISEARATATSPSPSANNNSVSTKKLIEVHVDGEVRMIPDFDFEDEIPETTATVYGAASGGGSINGNQYTVTGGGGGGERARSTSSALNSRPPTSGGNAKGITTGDGATEAGGAAPLLPATYQPSTTMLIVQEPTALRCLLKAAERQKTPSLSILVDLARAKAKAIASTSIVEDEAAAAGGGSTKSNTNANTSTNNANKASASNSSKSARLARAAASNLGIELLQRSSAGDPYQALSILNNHWMVRRQIVFAIDNNTNANGTTEDQMQSLADVGGLIGCDSATANNMTSNGAVADGGSTSMTSRSVSPPAVTTSVVGLGVGGRLNSSASMSANISSSNAGAAVSVGRSSPAPAATVIVPKTPIASPTPAFATALPAVQAAGDCPVGGPAAVASAQRMILVQDPTPIRLLLRAAERQFTPALSLLTDFARKRYGNAPTTATSAAGGAGATTASSGGKYSGIPAPPSANSPPQSNTDSAQSSAAVAAGAPSHPLLLGLEILQRSHARVIGLPSLGILANHWMVRRQIVVAVKGGSAPPPSTPF